MVAKKTYDHKLNVLPPIVTPDDHYFIRQADNSVSHYIGDKDGIPRLVSGAGTASGEIITGIAGETLGGARLVYLNGGKFYTYSADNLALADALFGITTSAAVANGSVNILMSGIFIEVGWGLVTDREYYAGINGLITTSTSNPIITFIGIAVNSDTLKFNIQQSIITI